MSVARQDSLLYDKLLDGADIRSRHPPEFKHGCSDHPGHDEGVAQGGVQRILFLPFGIDPDTEHRRDGERPDAAEQDRRRTYVPDMWRFTQDPSDSPNYSVWEETPDINYLHRRNFTEFASASDASKSHLWQPALLAQTWNSAEDLSLALIDYFVELRG